MKEKKHNTRQYVPDMHHYTQTNTNNAYKTRVILQTTGSKDEPKIVFMRKS